MSIHLAWKGRSFKFAVPAHEGGDQRSAKPLGERDWINYISDPYLEGYFVLVPRPIYFLSVLKQCIKRDVDIFVSTNIDTCRNNLFLGKVPENIHLLHIASYLA